LKYDQTTARLAGIARKRESPVASRQDRRISPGKAKSQGKHELPGKREGNKRGHSLGLQ